MSLLKASRGDARPATACSALSLVIHNVAHHDGGQPPPRGSVLRAMVRAKVVHICITRTDARRRGDRARRQFLRGPGGTTSPWAAPLHGGTGSASGGAPAGFPGAYQSGRNHTQQSAVALNDNWIKSTYQPVLELGTRHLPRPIGRNVVGHLRAGHSASLLPLDPGVRCRVASERSDSAIHQAHAIVHPAA
jgi:hypothetical protein